MKDLMDSKSDNELLRSVLEEVAKASNEIRCAENDLKKSKSRMSFLIVLTNKLIKRTGDQQK